MEKEQLPTAPPSYEAVDVVQEFATRFEKRKETIRASFEKKKITLEKKHQLEMQNLNKEESKALQQLHASYVKWIIVEPPDQETTTTLPLQQKQDDLVSMFAWLFKK